MPAVDGVRITSENRIYRQLPGFDLGEISNREKVLFKRTFRPLPDHKIKDRLDTLFSQATHIRNGG
jgi:hypothetical protein